jgi:heterodisulfide reductase subunit B
MRDAEPRRFIRDFVEAPRPGKEKGGSEMTREYTVYLGCMIPMRFPSVEIAAHKVFEALGAKLHDLPGYTCCPDPVLGRLAEPEFSLALSARNLAMAAKSGRELLVLCNGCFETLVEAEETLSHDAAAREKAAEALAREGLEYKPGLRIRGFIDALAEDFGADAIHKLVVKPATGVRAACHTGCHMLRSKAHPKERVKLLESLAEATGAQAARYPLDTLCCGFPAATASEDFAIESVIAPKHTSIADSGANAIVTGCPTCLYQLEAGQSALRKRGLEANLPVLHMLELMWMSFGADPSRMGLELHQSPAKEFATKHWGPRP